MPIKDWFQSKRKQPQLDAKAINNRLSDEQLNELWTKCYGCQSNLPKKELETSLKVCTKCGYHFRIGAKERIEQLCDAFHELNEGLLPADPLAFEDTQKYSLRQKEAREKSELNEAIITGIAKINTQSLALGIMDFGYMGGSMGSVVGEKITRLAEAALEKQLPLVLFSSSGGARMQEGTFSLMQMVKTGAVLSRLHEAGLLYISVLTEPTFGGVTASYGMLGDVIIAEEGARVGFAGRRVIEQTIRQKLPSDFQTSGYLLKYGQIDMEIKRGDLKQTLYELIRLHTKASNKTPGAYESLVS